jgi:hypothetical protein
VVHDLRHRKPSQLNIASRPFAVRLGGNQEFTSDDASFTRIPDAAASFSWKPSFHLQAFADVELWKASLIECVGICLQVYTSGLVSAGLDPLAKSASLGPVAPAAFRRIVNVALISLFIFAAGPVSGGHLTPLITMSTFRFSNNIAVCHIPESGRCGGRACSKTKLRVVCGD